ncbi:MAG: LysR substrate-binding domain-containing protein [Neorhizobium sp.]|nr:LysR substrate-binding domain-containing protein [Neorhizobium sp.]
MEQPSETRLDTRHMRHVVALADTLHFGHAAARMNMSQPPFSRQIAAIEQALGVTLFERNSRSVSLTPAGRHFAAECRRVLAGFEAACRDVRLVADGMKGELKLGFTMYSAHSVVPSLVRRYAQLRPDVRLVLEERIPTDLDDMLIEGRLDAAVTFGASSHGAGSYGRGSGGRGSGGLGSYGPASGGPVSGGPVSGGLGFQGLGAPGRLHGTDPPHLKTVLLARDRLCLVLPASHSLVCAETIVPQDLDGERLIAAPSTVAPVLRAAIASWCAVGGVKPLVVLEPRLQHTIIRLVAEGLGVALIPQSLCHDLQASVVARPLADAPEFDVILCAPVASQNPTVAALMQMARET